MGPKFERGSEDEEDSQSKRGAGGSLMRRTRAFTRFFDSRFSLSAAISQFPLFSDFRVSFLFVSDENPCTAAVGIGQRRNLRGKSLIGGRPGGHRWEIISTGMRIGLFA